MEYTAFDRELSDAFHGGERRSRELRLSEEQLQYVSGLGSAQVEPLGGQWYQVTFEGGMDRGA